MTKQITDLVVAKVVEILAMRNCNFTVEDTHGNIHSSRNTPQNAKPKVERPYFDVKPLQLDEFVKGLKDDVTSLEYLTPEGCPIETLQWAVNRAGRYVHGYGVCSVKKNAEKTGVVIYLRPKRNPE